MKRILAFFLLCLLLTGCAGESVYVPTGDGLSDGTGTVAQTKPEDSKSIILVYNDQASMNPYESGDVSNRTLFSLIYQGLFAVDRDYDVEPILCKNYQVSDDLRSYTFYLENATFSDGSALTAQDVVASLEKAKSASYYSGRFGHVKSIVAGEDGSVVVNLTDACENLPLLLDIPIVKAEQVDAAAPMGTGPYVFETTQLRRQAAWWCSAQTAVNVSSIALVTGEDPSQIRDRFERENLSLVTTDPGVDNYADFRGDYELWDSENGLFVYLGFNMKSKVFSNTALRAAVTYGIDRNTLTAEQYRGFAQSATLPASPATPYYSQSLARRYGYDPEKLKQAVTDAQLESNAVTLLVNKDDSRRVRVARAIAEMLEEAGLKVTVSSQSSDDFRSALKKGNYDLYLGQTKLSANMDLTEFFKEKGSLCYGGMSNVAASALSLEALANAGNYYNLHKLVMEEGLLCPILFRSYAIYGRWGVVTGLSPARDNVFYYSLGKTMENALLPNE